MQKSYSDEQIQKSLQNLQQNLSDHDVLNGSQIQVVNGADICHDYTRNSLKRINANDCCFNKSIFRAVAAVGSRFSSVHFRKCDFSASNFQYCNFDSNYFEENTFAIGANFSHSIFIECHFNNIDVKECTFFDCQFHGCTFSSSKINSITLENSLFSHCIIRDMDLAHLNLEYIQIDEISMQDVILPPYQLAYIIGGPHYLFTTNDSVFIYTDNGKVSIAQYKKTLDDLLLYYHLQNEYFPMANIMIGLDKFEKALAYIQEGIREAFDYFDFRMVKHYCKLAISCGCFSHTQLKFLYDLITEISYKKKMGIKELHSYFINIGEVRELLLNTLDNRERVEFVIKTDIDKDDLSGVNELYNRINKTLKDCCSPDHIDSVELRHNSPYELLITCIDTLPAILVLIPAMYSLLSVGGKALDFWKKVEEVRSLHQQNSLYKYEKRRIELEIEEKEKNLNAQKDRQQTGQSGILSISGIEHNVICNDIYVASHIPSEYLHYKHVRDFMVS